MGRFFVTLSVGRWLLCGDNFYFVVRARFCWGFLGKSVFWCGVLVVWVWWIAWLMWFFDSHFWVVGKCANFFDLFFWFVGEDVLPDGPPARRAVTS